MAKPTITPHQLNMYTEPLAEIYRYLETDIFMSIAKRLKTSSDFGKDNVLQWQVERMQELRILNNETIKKLSKTTSIAEKEIRKIISDVGYGTIASVDKDLSPVYAALATPTELDRVLESYVNQTFRELDNYVNQTLITTNYGRGTVQKMYQRIVEETTAKVLAGQTTINKAVTETVIKWSKKGIETSFVDRGGHTWHLEHYADTVIRSTTNRAYNDLRLSRMDEYDVHLVLVSSLPDAREACSKIQGQVATMRKTATDGYPSIYDFGYGEPDGIRGINCRHILYPYVEGLNVNNEIQYDPEEARERGKSVQEQRRLERSVRESKRSLKLAEQLGDETSIKKYKSQVRSRQAKIRDYISEHELPRRYDKERVLMVQ